MRALAVGFLLLVMPAAADEPETITVPTGRAACDPNGPNCIVSRATLITSNLALDMAAQRIADLEEALKAKDAAIEELREGLAAEFARGPHCAEVKKIPVPGLKRTGLINGGAL